MIPGYLISEEIFRGRKRIVYRGMREEDNRAVILKTLSTEYPSDSDIANLKREYEIIKKLNDEGIVQAVAFAADKNRPALVLEDIGGKSLRAFIDNNEIDFTTSLDIAIKLVKAVAALHHCEIIHKDINPKNIIVNLDTEQVKLIDFSISSRLPKENQKISHPVFLEGTLAYMSPEQTGRMNRTIDYRTDFYSMGITIYEMLTTQLPFQVKDPMELVHCHIAKEPLPPVEVKNEIPAAVSDIVMKMLAKTAEKRYRSALGILADLQTCLKHWKASEKIDYFTPGEHDVKDRFQIPQKLYGRENEIATLLDGFDRVDHGITEMLLVSGYSGIGKSALVQEIHKPIVQKRGYFISGKFDQLQRTVPYSAIVAALRELMRQLLTESEQQLGVWKEKLLSALGINGQLIIDVIPEVELIIGSQLAVAELEPSQSENRFKLVFQNFISVFCKKTHPLVIFLDDLQWVDSASLKLIELMMTDQDTHFLYFLGAYRDNEVNPTHPLTTTLNSLKEENCTINEIILAPLDLNHISQLIAETVDRDDKTIEELAELVLRKTDGNPFFLRQFLKTLHQENLIYFDPKTPGWRWAIAKIEATDITNNVVDLMIRKLKKLPESVQKILQLAACIGNRFDLNSLSIVYEASPAEVSQGLWLAIQDGLVVSTSEFEAQVSDFDLNPYIHNPQEITFKFLHDWVQQAAYALIAESQKQIVHAKIGRLLLENLIDNEWEERIFELVDHLNIGRELLTGKEEKVELGRLNLQAGIKAKEATAYDSARDYLVAGIACLTGQIWTATYDLSFELHKHLADTEYLMGCFEKSEKLVEEILQYAKTTIERAQVFNTLVVQQTLNGEYARAIETGRKALAELVMDLPAHDLQHALEIELEQAKQALGDQKVGSLLEAPESTLPEIRIALKLLASICPLCYIYNPELCRVATLRMVNISLEHGHTPDSAFGYAFYGLFFSSFLKDYKSAYEFGELAIKLSEKFNSSAQKCKGTHVFAAFINHWSRHLNLIQKINDEGFQAGLESGELQFAGYHRYNRALCLFYMGKNLHALLPELKELMQFSQKTRNQHATDPIIAVQLIALNLTEQTESKLIFQNETLDDRTFEKDLVERKGIPALTHWGVMKAFVFYLYGQWRDALECITTAKDRLSFVSGHFSTAAHNFYHSLILTALYPQVPKKGQEEYWAQLRENQEQLKVWAENCPQNFLHKYLLVAAEMARINGQIWEASDLYDQAIDTAREYQFMHEEALANELAAKFYLNKSREKMARVYLSEARNIYRKWGAITKVKELEGSYPQYLIETAFEPTSTIEATMTHDLSSDSGTKSLDLRTVVKAAQTISSEIVLKTLLEKLIRIVIENAGAQKGFLILEKDKKLFIEAEGSVEEKEVTVLSSIPLETNGHSTKLPNSIINYVKRTRENLLIPDAGKDSQFVKDNYIQKNNPKSILCIPILDKGDLIGILYLENNLISGAFKPGRLEVMQILSSQSAISLQNSRLYEELRKALKEVEQLKNQLQAENVYLQEEIKHQHNFEEIVCQNKSFKKVLGKVEQVAVTDATVLILGETGTGKELFARAVHNLSNRRNRPLVKVNCAALPANLIESELFGHEKGAFTGALSQRVGRFELGDGGTVFLDEIGDLPLELQAKLLRVLQEGEFERLGNPHSIKVDVRVIAATNRNLEIAMEDGTFRKDLYYRLNVFPINIAPLRERIEDVPVLVKHFISKFSVKLGKNIEVIAQDVMEALQKYSWPGNVRELENIIERAMIICPGKKLEFGDWLPQKTLPAETSKSSTLEVLEKNHILEVLEQTDWRIRGERGAATILGLKPTTLEARMKKFGIERKK